LDLICVWTCVSKSMVYTHSHAEDAMHKVHCVNMRGSIHMHGTFGIYGASSRNHN